MFKSLIKTIIYKPLYNALIFLVWLIPGHSVGWAIIILTILIRLLLLPSSAKTVKIQKKMQELQPELDKIKEKYKDDKQTQAKVMMEFYQQNKVNPLGGCLPMLIQLPFLYVLYYVFRAGLTEIRADLLYAATPHIDKMNIIFYGINLNDPNTFLAVLAGALQFISAKQMLSKQKQTANVIQKNDFMGSFQNMLSSQMTYFFPLITVVIALKLPSALALYWVVTTICMVIQQWWIYKSKDKNVTVKIRK